MQRDNELDIGVLIALERQVETLRDTELIIRTNHLSEYEKARSWEHTNYADFVGASVQRLKDENPGEPDPFPFKPRGSDGSLVCYLIAEFNYANGIAICNLIGDPKIKQDCLDKNRKSYCDAWKMCGGVER